MKQKMQKEQELLKKLYAVEADPSVDPKLHEFMSVMKPRSSTKTWANDESAVVSKPGSTKVKTVVEQVALKRPGGQVIMTYAHAHMRTRIS